MLEEKRRKPSENNPRNANTPMTEKAILAAENPWKNRTPKTSPKTMMIPAWINDFVIPDRLTPSMMCVRGMGLASISRISPQFLSNRRLIPP
jgi:hypothetical protein